MTNSSLPTSTLADLTAQTMRAEEREQQLDGRLEGGPEFQFTKDFRFLPIPLHLRYKPRKPPHFGIALNIAFGFASTFIIANLYYCQPLLIQLSTAFNITYGEVSRQVFATDSDSCSSRFRLWVISFDDALSSCAWGRIYLPHLFEVLSFFVGVLTVTPQILIPLAADLAPEKRRASAISIVLAGLFFGILVARVLSGVIGEFASWRVVYYFAIGVQAVVLVGCYLMLPDYPPKNKDLTYFDILLSMARFAVTEPILIQACLIDMASSACFSNFWVTLTFLLGGPPYYYSTLVIGLLGLVGMAGVAGGPFVGRFIDRLVPWYATLIAIIMLLLFQSVQTGAGGTSVGAVIIAAFGMDIFRQMLQVSLTTAVFGISSSARARLNAVSILSLFIGQVIGSSVGSSIFLKFGWRAAAAFSMGLYGLQLLILFLRGPHCKRYTWFGYEGGLNFRKDVVQEQRAPQTEELDIKDALQRRSAVLD